MIEVTVPGLSSAEISELLRELRAMNLVPGKDFDFAYSPGRYDWINNQEVGRHTVFTWYNDTAGTWFALRWL